MTITKIKVIFAVFVMVTNGMIWYAVNYENRGNILTVTFLNIGQGDAIFIQAPNGNQVVVDGGPPQTILRELSHVMPFYDRSVDMLVVTNPDADHMSGFIDVLHEYKVDKVIEPGTFSPSATYTELEKSVSKSGASRILARRNMNIWLDRPHGIYLNIILPDRDVSEQSTNDGSIIMKLHYGQTSYMLMGDAPQKMETYAMALGSDVRADVLKLGHHGSRTSSGEEFVAAVHPALAVISAGLNNKYGHPHKETIDTLKKLHVPYLITFEHGRIITQSDGRKVWVK